MRVIQTKENISLGFPVFSFLPTCEEALISILLPLVPLGPPRGLL